MDWKSIILHYLLVAKENIAVLLGIILTFLTPIAGMLITVGLFIAADTIFAIYVEVKKGGWDAYRSGKLFNLATKSFFYLGGVILAYLVDFFIVAVPIWGIPLLITKIVCGLFIYIEVKSLDETSVKLGNRSLWEVLKEIINKGKDIKKDINKIKDE